MIRSGTIPGLAFGHELDGDARSDTEARLRMSTELGIPAAWATVRQVHGTDVVRADGPGDHGEADGIVTATPGLPITVATADCLPIALAGERSIALVHAGWRGLAAGVIDAGRAAITDMGDDVRFAVIGPHIRSCCYEVGDDVVDQLGGFAAETRAGTRSADLTSAALARLDGIRTEVIDICTMDDPEYASYRETGTAARQVTVAWLT
jgi:YfiH family protein